MIARIREGLLVQSKPTIMDEMVYQLQMGRLDLEPHAQSGWYDYQLWALSGLIIVDENCESARLKMTVEYRSHLESLFKGLYALTRETHLKQSLSYGWGSAPPRLKVFIGPELRVEPLPTFYYRRALSYRFIRQILIEIFGPAALNDISRLTAAGNSNLPLLSELAEIEAIFHGAAVAACEDIVLEPSELIGSDSTESLAAFLKFGANVCEDRDLAVDCRMMVPVEFNPRRGTRVWAMLGWSDVDIMVSWDTVPKILSYTQTSRPLPGSASSSGAAMQDFSQSEIEFEPQFVSTVYSAQQPVMAEVWVTRLMDRGEFQAHCNRHKSVQAILSNLK